MDGVQPEDDTVDFETELRRGRVVVRFAGDSGDGIQLLGGAFGKGVATSERDMVTFSDFPAEIRAPVGTLFGVSAFQIQFGGPRILTIGDQVDVLIAFNPAALKTNFAAVRSGGLIFVDKSAFTKRNLDKAGYDQSPIESGALVGHKVIEVDITRLAREAVADAGVSKREADRTKNFWVLGLTFWMFDQDRAPVVESIQRKFGSNSALSQANILALNAGHAFGETLEIGRDHVPTAYRANLAPGIYRAVNGTETLVYGLLAASVASGRPLCYCSYPITPASNILHALSTYDCDNVRTFQAEDEIAAVCAAIGASYGGALGVTASSGPGIALKGEAIGLAVGAELPLVVINVQRAGPSTGMPTKTEQADLNLALYGRHGEAPAVVIAPAKSAECFEAAVQACHLSTKYMVPVILLLDGYIANASEPWKIPDLKNLPKFAAADPIMHNGEFLPFGREPRTLARAWVAPGTRGLEHRIGGIERSDGSGHISYDPENHQKMTEIRALKVMRAAEDLPRAVVDLGANAGDVAVVGWGSTYGPIEAAVNELLKEDRAVSHIHLRSLSPLPEGLEDLLRQFSTVLIVEMNTGQLNRLIRSEFLIPTRHLNQTSGQPFSVAKVKQAIRDLLEL